MDEKEKIQFEKDMTQLKTDFGWLKSEVSCIKSHVYNHLPTSIKNLDDKLDKRVEELKDDIARVREENNRKFSDLNWNLWKGLGVAIFIIVTAMFLDKYVG